MNTTKQNKSMSARKRYRRTFFYFIDKHMQKFRHFWRKEILPKKVTYVPLAPSHSIINIVFSNLYNWTENNWFWEGLGSSRVCLLYGFWNSLTFHDLFLDLFEFSMTNIKQLFSKYLLSKVFSRIIKCMLVFIFLLELTGFFTCLLVFQLLICFCCSSSECLLLFHDFPWPTFQFQAWKMKL